MSHELDNSTGRYNFAYVGDPAWHKFGDRMSDDATVGDWIARVFPWGIEKRPVVYGIKSPDGTITPTKVPNLFAHVRTDTQACIGHGSGKFKLVQPREALEFFADLVGESDGRFKLETAGSLKGGRVIWAAARSVQRIVINGQDEIRPYLFFTTANDGTASTQADFTMIRPVCNNTLSAAVGENSESRVRVPHSRQFDASAVKRELGLLDGQMETFANDVDTLANAKMDDETVLRFFASLYEKRDATGDVTNKKNVEKTVSKLFAAYRRSPGAQLDTARGTAWGAVNAVTYHVDHAARAHNEENRFTSAQFGIGAELKKLAFNRALELVAA